MLCAGENHIRKACTSAGVPEGKMETCVSSIRQAVADGLKKQKNCSADQDCFAIVNRVDNAASLSKEWEARFASDARRFAKTTPSARTKPKQANDKPRVTILVTLKEAQEKAPEGKTKTHFWVSPDTALGKAIQKRDAESANAELIIADAVFDRINPNTFTGSEQCMFSMFEDRNGGEGPVFVFDWPTNSWGGVVYSQDSKSKRILKEYHLVIPIDQAWDRLVLVRGQCGPGDESTWKPGTKRLEFDLHPIFISECKRRPGGEVGKLCETAAARRIWLRPDKK